ncbi:hypothetical protein AAHE18_19G043100 [Arachis hypogaea]
MERAIIIYYGVLLLTLLCASFIYALVPNTTNIPGFITIDCGSSKEYLDEETGIWYETDKSLVETGKNWKVPGSSNLNDPYFGKPSRTVRCFPEGVRNCYTLRAPQQQRYLIRAIFTYANYDAKNQSMTFDIHLGVNSWATVSLDSNLYWSFTEIIYTHTSDSIQVCLVKTGQSTPCISSLELRPLNTSVYALNSTTNPQSLLCYQSRIDVASLTSPQYMRYRDDVYDRIWRYDRDVDTWRSLVLDDNSTAIDVDAYKLPSQVMKTAAQSLNMSHPLELGLSTLLIDLDDATEYYVYFHFVEIQKLTAGKKRLINIALNSQSILSQPLVLEYLKPVTVGSSYTAQVNATFSISAALGSEAPPILNAFEVYKLITQIDSPTDPRDVGGMRDIKSAYQISRLSWQGDPCLPDQFAWEGLTCNYQTNPRITSLNLSSSKLRGKINSSFSYLTELEYLDLSNNELEGSLPEFLADLSRLKVLNLTGNNLSGLIPKALRKKVADASLQLSVGGNPNLCVKDSCNNKKFVTPLMASLAAALILILLIAGFWIFQRRRKQKEAHIIKEGASLKLKQAAFTYNEILSITDNFKTMIGEGGFGKVYFGILPDHTQVAIKLLSPSSRQGYTEFQSEVHLHSLIRHRNLVSLVGYCDEGENKALIYEYMSNGNLRQHLSRENPYVLNWNERLNIAIDAVNGLNYLHNGCNPSIVHRDLKTSNILLDQWKHAKIADFGLSRAFRNDIDSHISTCPAGTPGYIDPEFQRVGCLNKKSDIYSTGIILLELISGRPAISREAKGEAIHILEWVRPIFERGDDDDIQNIVDSRLLQGEFNVDSARKVVQIAVSCASPTAAERPDINQVLVELKECLSFDTPEVSVHIETDCSLISGR